MTPIVLQGTLDVAERFGLPAAIAFAVLFAAWRLGTRVVDSHVDFVKALKETQKTLVVDVHDIKNELGDVRDDVREIRRRTDTGRGPAVDPD